MSRIGTPDKSSISVAVSDLNNLEKSVNGVSVGETEVALAVSDHGAADLASTSFNALSVGTTAINLAKLTTNKVDVRARRGIQFKAAAGNSGTIVLEEVLSRITRPPLALTAFPWPPEILSSLRLLAFQLFLQMLLHQDKSTLDCILR